MFDVVPLIVERLAQALPAKWVVCDGGEAQDRTGLPRADVRLDLVSLSHVSGPSLKLQPRYVVTLVVEADRAVAFKQLDEALDAAVANVHHWRPSPKHERLMVAAVTEAPIPAQRLFGYDLIFTLTTSRTGCDD